MLADWDGYEADITLKRTLTAGMWNTLALPFDISCQNLIALQKLIGAQGGTIAVKELTGTTLSGTIITLNFADATEVKAGKPYLVKVLKALDFSTQPATIDALGAPVNPFKEVEVSKEAKPVETDDVVFVPTLGKTLVTGPTDNEGSTDAVLFLAANNELKNPSVVNDPGQQSSYMKGFRAYFQVKGASAARSFSLNLGEETIGVQFVATESQHTGQEARAYDLQGRRVESS